MGKVLSRGYLYLIGAVDHKDVPYKIGCTTNLNQRLKAIQSNHWMELSIIHATDAILDYHRAEQSVHFLFAPKRLNNEWFRLDKKDVAKVQRIFKNPDMLNEMIEEYNKLPSLIRRKSLEGAYGINGYDVLYK